MTATVTGGGPVTSGTVTGGTATGRPAPARRRAARRRFAFPRASTTPGKVRLIRMGLVIGCLGWGALAAVMVGQHASAAGDAASVSEPLSLDAQQMYQSLADADVTASTGYLYGRIQPFPGRQRYEHDIAVATEDLKAVTAASRDPAVSGSLTTLSAELPVYTGYVEDGEIYNSLGYPAGASFIQVASEEMHLRLLPAARTVYAHENARLTAASAQATGLPLAVVTLAADFRAAQGQLGTLLTSAGRQSTASATGSIAAARQDANSWFAVNQQAQRLDKALDYGAETRLVIGSGPGTAGTLFGRLEADLDAAIRAGRATFAGGAAAGSDAFTGLEAGIVVLALTMATGSAWGLSRRLAEYR